MSNMTDVLEVGLSEVIPTFNTTLDLVHGIVYFLSALIGLLGNFLCFIFFRSRKRDVSNSIYQVITINDLVISLCVVPVSVVFLRDRSPGLLFSTHWTCGVWGYLWNSNCRLSVFLVVVLCCSRTWSLLRPFTPQSIRAILLSVLGYFVLTIVQLAAINLQKRFEVNYEEVFGICYFEFKENGSSYAEGASVTMVALEIFMIFAYCIPLLVVVLSCSISTYLLTVSSSLASSSPRRLLDSRFKASLTILIFSLVYLVFNLPLVLFFIVQSIEEHTGIEIASALLKFDTRDPEFYHYFSNFIYTLSTALNSACNPLLYLWRMKECRRYIWNTVLLRRRRSDITVPCSRVMENNNKFVTGC